MIQVEVASIILVNMGKEFIVLLRNSEDDRTLPISIGQPEAQSIAVQINKMPFPRPLTHDLFRTVMTEFNCDLEYIVIHDIIDETFYANLILKGHGKKITIDCRPSDAIAIALRFSKPIFVEENVMNKAALYLPEVSQEKSLEHTTTVEQNEAELSAEELLNKKLEDAIRDERYEDAARYRDEIRQLSTAN